MPASFRPPFSFRRDLQEPLSDGALGKSQKHSDSPKPTSKKDTPNQDTAKPTKEEEKSRRHPQKRKTRTPPRICFFLVATVADPGRPRLLLQLVQKALLHIEDGDLPGGADPGALPRRRLPRLPEAKRFQVSRRRVLSFWWFNLGPPKQAAEKEMHTWRVFEKNKVFRC